MMRLGNIPRSIVRAIKRLGPGGNIGWENIKPDCSPPKSTRISATHTSVTRPGPSCPAQRPNGA